MEMGLKDSLSGDQVVFKRKFRWLFKIPEICIEGVFALPPLRGSRPTYSFKEVGVQHLTEEIFYPMKVEWKPINLVLYDTAKPIHPVIEWISLIHRINYNCDHKFIPSVSGEDNMISAPFKKLGKLELYDGCGNIIEQWKFENCWPQSVEFGDLDMASNDIVTVNITLRYDRACWIKGCP